MTLDYIRLLYDYTYWATAQVLRTAEEARIEPDAASTPERHTRSGQVHETLVHMMGAEWLWRSRWQGVSPAAGLPPGEFPTLQALRTRWQDEERQMRAFLATLHEADLAREITYTNLKGQRLTLPLGPLLLQVVNHGTQHRSEVALVLTALGHSPGDLDLLIFLLQGPPATKA
jgi:uncharacterized damage-inducible protein DinB